MTLYELIKDGFSHLNRGGTMADYLAEVQKNMGVSPENAAIIAAVLLDGESAI